VDKSFVLPLGPESGNSEIISAVFQLAIELGLDVVAEGVETDQAASRLKDMGGTIAQGFCFARPTAVENLFLPCSKKETEALKIK
jgi:EAL domain-containing protein (putative c-di-GMP-specific phosphodiesterase class I)